MPRYRRRYYRRSRRALSIRRIYGHRSARAQASQILALNRRISRVARTCKPEKKVFVEQANTVVFDSGATGTVFAGFGDTNIQRGPNNSDRIGNLIRGSTRYLLNFEYYNNSTTGYHDSESSGVQVRIILGRQKYPNANNAFPSPQSLVYGFSTSGDGYTHSTINPLQSGITEKALIDYDKVFYLTADKNQRVVKVKTPIFTRRFDDAANTDWSNHAFLLVIVGGLHYDNDFQEYVNMALTRKTVFTDS